MADGVPQERRPELVGGGLRSQGGWSQVESLRREGVKGQSDDRVPGDGAFVERIAREADEMQKRGFSRRESLQKADEFLRQACVYAGISLTELQAGGRRGDISAIRSKIAHRLIWSRGE